MYGLDDTIVAVSSPAGAAPRGIVRLSGPDAVALACHVFVPEAGPTTAPRGWCWQRGRCRLDAAISCDALAYWFRAPASYTAQDLVELHCPGAPALLEMVIETLLAAGARRAEPGEFTARAFFNGRLDLTEAEAVAEVVSAASDQELRAAQRLLRGQLQRACLGLADGIADVLALVELGIDFSEEDLEPVAPAELGQRLADVQDQLAHLLSASVSWDRLHHLPRVVLAGATNAGKSALANALLGAERSIVTALEGATRDCLTAPLRLSGGDCLLVDTAGLGPVADPLAAVSQAATRAAVRDADLLLWVVDGATATEQTLAAQLAERPEGVDWRLVINKCDRFGTCPPGLDLDAVAVPVCIVSATRGDGLEALRKELSRTLHLAVGRNEGDSIALTSRQRRALLDVQAALTAAQQLQADTATPELVALELRAALDHVGTISGAVLTDHVLARIFERFCIGK